MRTIVLTGGGTAGHVLPNIALLPHLRKNFDQICYIGGNGIEQQIAQKNGLPYYQITTVKLRRKLTLSNLAIPFKLLKGIREAKKILRQLKPDVIFSKGGFVALPVVYAAHALKIKVVAHESDFSMGLANRLTAKKCAVICTTFPINDQCYPQMVQTGAILRSSIYYGDKTKIPLPINGRPNVLVIGGSLGATAINQVVWQDLRALCAQFNVVHVTGKGKANPACQHPAYWQTEYLDKPEDAFAWADMVVARAGSGTVSELMALQKPAVYVPLPKDESRGDQIQNADYCQKLGVCTVLPQSELNTTTLVQALLALSRRRDEVVANCQKQTWIDGTQKVVSYLQ